MLLILSSKVWSLCPVKVSIELMGATMTTFEKVRDGLGVVASISAIAALIPLALTFFGVDWFHNALRMAQAETLGQKGFTYYEPISETPGVDSAWYLLKNKPSANFEDLEAGDILKAAHAANVRYLPTKEAREGVPSRPLFSVQPGECVLVLGKESNRSVPAGAGWLHVSTVPCPD